MIYFFDQTYFVTFAFKYKTQKYYDRRNYVQEHTVFQE